MVCLNAPTGLSGASSVIGLCESDTVTPRRTRAAASRTFCEVTRFIVPSSSPAPQRRQLLISRNIASNSAAVRGVLASSVRTVAAVASRARAVKAATQTLAVTGLRVIRCSTLAAPTGRSRFRTRRVCLAPMPCQARRNGAHVLRSLLAASVCDVTPLTLDDEAACTIGTARCSAIVSMVAWPVLWVAVDSLCLRRARVPTLDLSLGRCMLRTRFSVLVALLSAPLAAPSARPQEPRATARDVVAVIARVERVDLFSRSLTLKAADGITHVVYVGPELEVFRELKTGDNVLVRITESLIVEAQPGARTTGVIDTTAAAKRAPEAATGDVLQQLKAVVTVESVDLPTQIIVYKGGD